MGFPMMPMQIPQMQQPQIQQPQQFMQRGPQGTVGYKMELQMKLPMKKGYSMKDEGSYSEGEQKIIFKSLYRDKEKNPCELIQMLKILTLIPVKLNALTEFDFPSMYL